MTPEQLAAFTQRVAAANNWQQRPAALRYPPFKHVVYIIKENRTYDQVLGDIKEGAGDSSLVYFPDHTITPNHHALARRFGLFDRFFVNAEHRSGSQKGWTSAAPNRVDDQVYNRISWLMLKGDASPPVARNRAPLHVLLSSR
jgi:phospholipase C